jgi:hypothetical protein
MSAPTNRRSPESPAKAIGVVVGSVCSADSFEKSGIEVNHDVVIEIPHEWARYFCPSGGVNITGEFHETNVVRCCHHDRR